MRYDPQTSTLVAEERKDLGGPESRKGAYELALDDMPLQIHIDLRPTREASRELADEIARFSILLMRQARTLVVHGADPSLRSDLEGRGEDLGVIEFR